MSETKIGRSPALRLVAGGLVGLAIGFVVTVALLYDRSGRGLVNRVKSIAGLQPSHANSNNNDRFAFGDIRISKSTWQPVRSPTNPQWEVRRGLDVELVAEGLDYPVNLAFVPEPGPDPDSPVFFVNEMHGRIRYVGRDGKLHTFAEDLLDLEPVLGIHKSDETGLTGLAIVPGTEDLLVCTSRDDPESGLLINAILRLYAEPGGKRVDRVETLLELNEYTSPSNQIQQAVFGPDEKLYVSVGDAENHLLSLDLNRFGGKILRMELDGSACEDNPFYDEFAPDAPRSYVYAYGCRNVFDLEFSPETGRLYASDNGKDIDRFFEVIRGASYGWDGNPESIRINSLYCWGPNGNPAPVGLTILRSGALGEGTAGRAYLATYGPPAELGPNAGKSILEFVIDPTTGILEGVPEPILRYVGETRGNVLGLAEGPDGLYFTDFFGESRGIDEARGRIYKVVRSEETLGLPTTTDDQLSQLSQTERGKVYFANNCVTCHTLDGVGGREGPDLTNVIANLHQRLNSRSYLADLKRLMASEQTFLVEQRDRLREVAEAEGDRRIEQWLHHHLEEPRFDHPYAKMPSFAFSLPEEHREDIINFLMSRR